MPAMIHLYPDDYLTSPEGLRAQYRRRWHRRIYFDVEGVEPRSKKAMPERDRNKVQEKLLGLLVNQHRRAFRSPLALQLRLNTTESTPSHSHNIAKNLLDLFAKPRPALATRRRGLLYADDSQVHALSVTCHHQLDNEPRIWAFASSLRDLLEDLRWWQEINDLIEGPGSNREDNFWDEQWRLDQALERVGDLLRDEVHYRGRLGDRNFEGYLRIARQEAQDLLLGVASLTPTDLAYMYNVSGRSLGIELGSKWAETFNSTTLRITLSELPQADGTSAVWKKEIDEKLRAFQSEYGWIIDPLVVPVALEVVIKPPSPSRQRGLHDLDNVLRNYLIPSVVKILKPGSRFPSQSSVTRYEAWRLPPASEGTKGFVSVAVVSDLTGHHDVFQQIDDDIEAWLESLD